jgi:heme/copper-type cytochrome/quinol oxidase subunit 3
MNVFELATIVAPLAGMVAGISAAAGQSLGIVLACAIVGILIGAAALFGPFFAAYFVYERVRDPNAPPESPGAIEWLAGTTVVLVAAASTVIAWLVANFALSRLIGLVG